MFLSGRSARMCIQNRTAMTMICEIAAPAMATTGQIVLFMRGQVSQRQERERGKGTPAPFYPAYSRIA